MEKVQLNFTEMASLYVTSGTVFRRTTTELYDLYTHPEDISLFIQIVGNDKTNTPNIYIDNVSLKDLYYVLSRLTRTALDNCIVWLRASNGRPLQEFAVACHKRYEDFAVYDRSFRLCDFSVWSSDEPESWSNTLILHEAEVTDTLNNIKNIINNH